MDDRARQRLEEFLHELASTERDADVTPERDARDEYAPAEPDIALLLEDECGEFDDFDELPSPACRRTRPAGNRRHRAWIWRRPGESRTRN
jgi:hypothetical protein